MKLVLLHLSDLHCQGQGSAFKNKIEALVAAIASHVVSANKLIIAHTGDVADSGAVEEFESAQSLIDLIAKRVKLVAPRILVEELYVPGNHDVDFPAKDIQSQRVSSFIATPSSVLRDADLLSIYTKSQQNFFEFVAKRNSTLDFKSNQYMYAFSESSLSGVRINFVLLNTSWLSQMKEKPGELYTKVPKIDTSQPTIHIVLMHHPYNWLTPPCHREVRTFLKNCISICLTGHEHSPDAGKIGSDDEGSSNCLMIDGGVLCNNRDTQSSFNLIAIDEGRQTLHAFSYFAKDSVYIESPLKETPLAQFLRRGSHIQVKASFERQLSSMDLPFQHPNRQEITLDDLYVIPDLEVMDDIRSISRDQMPSLSLDELLLNSQAESVSYIIAAELSGKTALAKYAFRHFYQFGDLPVLLNANALKKDASPQVEKTIASALCDQYEQLDLKSYFSKEYSKRVAIIDDWPAPESSAEQQRNLLDSLRQYFSKIIIATNYSQYVDLALGADQGETLNEHYYTLLPLSYRQKNELVTKWLKLNPKDDNGYDLNRRVDETLSQIAIVFGRNLLPHFPYYVLTILQALHGRDDQIDIKIGAYGYQYDLLVKLAVGKIARKLTNESHKLSAMVDTLFSFYGEIALEMFECNVYKVDEFNLKSLAEKFVKDYGISIPVARLLRASLTGEILSADSEGRILFRQKLYRHFFLADKLAKLKSSLHGHLRAESQLEALLSKVGSGESSNAIMVYLYLTKDSLVLEKLIDHCENLFRGTPQIQFNLSLNRLLNEFAKIGPMQLTVDDSAQNRSKVMNVMEKRERRVDAANRPERLAGYPDSGDDSVEDFQRRSDSIHALRDDSRRSLTVLGQVLKNFPGTLDRFHKTRLMKVCLNLGLRRMQASLNFMERDVKTLEKWLHRAAKNSSAPSAGITEFTERLFSWMALRDVLDQCLLCARVIGSEELRIILDDMLREESTIERRLIDCIVRINHFKEFPKDHVLKLASDLRKNSPAWSILRMIVLMHFYLYSVERSTRDAVCSKLEIRTNDVRVIARKPKAR